VTTAKRSPGLAGVPTMAEAGVPDYDVSVWFGLMAPAGTAPEIVQKIQADVKTALTSPALAQKLDAIGMDVMASSPAEFSSLLRADVAKWTQVVKQASIKFD
jgi:tripartite-type tricarboxylate transporter receptor subunit TctC